MQSGYMSGTELSILQSIFCTKKQSGQCYHSLAISSSPNGQRLRKAGLQEHGIMWGWRSVCTFISTRADSGDELEI